MTVIFSRVVYGFPFYFGDVREYGYGLGCEIYEEILDFGIASVQSVFQNRFFSPIEF